MRKIIAIGGGGFGSPDSAGLPELLRKEIPGASPIVGFLPTASGDAEGYIAGFEAHAGEFGFVSKVFSLFRPQYWQHEFFEEISKCDAIYVGGGNTRNMIRLWREWGIDDALQTAYESEIPLMGVSAGAICWFRQGNTDSLGPQLSVLDCLGWLPGSCTPHFDEEPERRPMLEAQLRAGDIQPGYALTRGAGLVIENEEPTRLLQGMPDSAAYFADATQKDGWLRRLFS